MGQGRSQAGSPKHQCCDGEETSLPVDLGVGLKWLKCMTVTNAHQENILEVLWKTVTISQIPDLKLNWCKHSIALLAVPSYSRKEPNVLPLAV